MNKTNFDPKVVIIILSILLSCVYSAIPSIYDQSVIQAITADSISEKCGDWYVFKSDKCYTLLSKDRLKSYEEAKTACKQTDAQSSLVFIDSKEELKFLSNIIYGEQDIAQNAWIGGVIAMFESDINIDNDVDTDCIEMRRAKGSGDARMHYTECGKRNVVVCQKEINEQMANLKAMVNSLNDNYKNMESKLKYAEHQLQEMKNMPANERIKSDTGLVAYFASTSAPSGWLIANGSAVSRATYSNLFNTIGTVFGSGDEQTTFHLPDLRGEFIRGWSAGRNGVDKARIFGSFQYATNIPLSGYIDNTAYHAMSSGYHDRWSFAGATFDNGFEANIKAGDVRDGTRFPDKTSYLSETSFAKSANQFAHITSWNLLRGTRPRNIALLACIKY